MDLILSERQRVDTIYFMMSEENVKLQLRQPWIKIGTDAGGHDPEKAEGAGPPPLLRHLSRGSWASTSATRRCSRSRTRSGR